MRLNKMFLLTLTFISGFALSSSKKMPEMVKAYLNAIQQGACTGDETNEFCKLTDDQSKFQFVAGYSGGLMMELGDFASQLHSGHLSLPEACEHERNIIVHWESSSILSRLLISEGGPLSAGCRKYLNDGVQYWNQNVGHAYRAWHKSAH